MARGKATNGNSVATEWTAREIDDHVSDVETAVQALDTTCQTLATEATVATLATEATAATLATEATVALLGTEVTLAAVEADTTTLAGTVKTGSFVGAIDVEHQKIHEGKHFEWSSDDADVDIATPREWHIKTGATAVPHMTLSAYCLGSGGVWQLYEAPTVTNDGTPATGYNSNRRSLTAPEVLVYDDPTVTGGTGTLLDTERVGSAGGPVKIGGEADRRNELILAASTSYVVRFTATADNTPAGLHARWYEVP